MAGGLVGYLGYDMVRLMENLPETNPRVIDVPDGLMLRPTLFAIFDNVNDEISLIRPATRTRRSPRDGVDRAQARLAEAEAALERPLSIAAPPVQLPPPPAPVSNFTKDASWKPCQGEGIHRRRRTPSRS